MSGHLGWDAREDGMGPRAAGGRSHPGVSVGRTLHATLRGLEFVHLTVRSQRRFFIRSDKVTIVPWLCLSALLETLPLLLSIAQMCGVPPLKAQPRLLWGATHLTCPSPMLA